MTLACRIELSLFSSGRELSKASQTACSQCQQITAVTFWGKKISISALDPFRVCVRQKLSVLTNRLSFPQRVSYKQAVVCSSLERLLKASLLRRVLMSM